jgi:hypothetical protein
MILMQKHRIIFRVTDQEYQQIISEATRENMTVSDYIRNKLNQSMDNTTLTQEVRKLREDLDYLIDKDKRMEYAEARRSI